MDLILIIRSLYNDITTEKLIPKEVEVVRGHFELEDKDKALFYNRISRVYICSL
jgi:hypothetical protein